VRVLVTRPQPGAARTGEALRAGGHEPVVAPVLTVAPTGDAPPPGPFDALLATSAHAPPFLASLPDAASRPLYAVGERTAAAARDAGFATVRTGDGDALALARLVAAEMRPGAILLHAAGADRKPEPEASLQAAGFSVRVWAAYRAAAARRLPPPARAALGDGLDAALHFSRRSAATLVDLARGEGLLPQLGRIAHLCLSEDAAVPLRRAGFGRVLCADQPDENRLLALLCALQGSPTSPSTLSER